jgi:hypothetical protein
VFMTGRGGLLCWWLLVAGTMHGLLQLPWLAARCACVQMRVRVWLLSLLLTATCVSQAGDGSTDIHRRGGTCSCDGCVLARLASVRSN